MPALQRGVKRLAATAVLAALGCSTPDSSALYRPSDAVPPHTDTAAPPAMPDDPPGDVGDGASGTGGSSGGRTPVVVSPVSSITDAGLPSPVSPSEPTADAAPPNPAPSDAGAEPPSPPTEPLPPTEPPPPTVPACSGAPLGGVCWYLGELDQTCNAACAIHGGVDPASITFIGTPDQGGSLEACAAILQALGEPPGPVTDGFRDDDLGFGCHLFVDPAGATSAWWLTAPAFAPTVASPSARLVCGCTS